MSTLKENRNQWLDWAASRPDSMGLNVYVLLLALGMTVFFYIVVNMGLKTWLWSSSDNTLPDVRVASKSAAVLAEDYVELTGEDVSLVKWIQKFIRPNQTYPEQILELVNSIQRSSEKNDAKKTAVLENMLSGNCSGLIIVRVEKFSGDEILKKITDSNWRAALKEDPEGERKKAFIEKFIVEVQKLQAIPLRAISRFNGSIQNILVFVFMVAGMLLIRRYAMMNKLERELLNPDDLVKCLPPLDQTEDCVYRPISSIITTIPSLGFIGTVLGMGGALMKADNLFSALDKQQAMGKLTQELGFAFDTTFVALIFALILEMCFMWVRSKEARLIHKFSLDKDNVHHVNNVQFTNSSQYANSSQYDVNTPEPGIGGGECLR